MALQSYRQKRKFGVTTEPRGRTARGAGGNRFVVQKHAARRLHYDLRLELDGVMKSWAVTRGPSFDPSEKRLAIHVEDHPIEYNKFEGTIPKGEYGGGTVMVWDRGRWTADGDPHKGYAKGHLTFDLAGQKLHGRWHLVRMRRRPQEKKEAWLLIKAKDDAARTAKQPDILQEEPRSVVTNRTIDDIARGKKGGKAKANGRATNGARHVAKRSSSRPQSMQRSAPLPSFIAPSLATLHQSAPAGEKWIHEVKFDGYRIQARIDHGKVQLKTRKGLDWTRRFAGIADALSKLPINTALLDGEVVVEDADGVSDFSALQAALKHDRTERMVYYVFDLLHLDGHDFTRAAQIDRKAALAKLLKDSPRNGILRLSEHFDNDGKVVLKHACRMKLEGVVSKRSDRPYRSGRSDNWVKAKCLSNQEFAIAGYESSSKRGRNIRSLILGYFDGGKLRYAGRVGTGFSHEAERDLVNKLAALQADDAPFDRLPDAERRRKVRWVKPKLVAEIDFRGWTGGRILRQASFKGLREDKPAREIVKETPVMDAKAISKEKPSKSKTAAANSRPATSKSKLSRDRVDVGHVHITHPDRLYWADAKVTKRQLAEYYAAIWDWIAPHIVDRPLALVRCPEGTKGQCFFQKHIAAGIKNTSLRRLVDAKEKDVIAIADVDDLVSLVQSGVLEIHTRGSTVENLDRCNRIVFDLDPGDGVDWARVVEAARDVRERLAALKLESFVKLSGGKGLHVVLPVKDTDWETVKTFAQTVAMAMAADDPRRYVAKMTKSLRADRIFIDYFRNSRDATSVAAYSSRARAGAPVSTPVTWQELGRTESSATYTVLNLEKRLARMKADPWAQLLRLRQKLPDLRALKRQ